MPAGDAKQPALSLPARAWKTATWRERSRRPLRSRFAVVRVRPAHRDPWPCQSPSQLTLLRRLENQFLPLETSVKVGIGVATGNDSVFITQDAKLVEPSRLLKLALAKDIRGSSMVPSLSCRSVEWRWAGILETMRVPLRSVIRPSRAHTPGTRPSTA
jgi:hypothetical protein